MVKIDFQIGDYRDAIVLPDDHTMTDLEIEAMKQARYDNWLAIIAIVPEETPQEPISEIAQDPVQETLQDPAQEIPLE